MPKFVKQILQLRVLFTKRDRCGYAVLLLAIIAGRCWESIGVAAIPLYVKALVSPSDLSENQWILSIFGQLPTTPTTSLLVGASGVLIVFIVVKNIFLSAVFYVQATVIRNQTIRLRDKVFRAYQSAPYDWIVQRSSAELLRNIQNDCTQMLVGVIVPILDLVMATTIILFIGIVMMLNASTSTMISFAVVAISVSLTISLFRRPFSRSGEVIRVEFGETVKAIQQAFGAVVDARIAGCEEFLAKAHHDCLTRLTAAERIRYSLLKVTPFVVETVSVIGLVVVFAILVQESNSIEQVVPVLAMLAFATVRLKQMMTKVATSINLINTSYPSIPAVADDFIELKQHEANSMRRRSKGGSIDDFKNLEVKNLTYEYPGTVKPALSGISLELKRGETIGLVGTTGCGKSTLANVILGLLDPNIGSVTVNGVDIRSDLQGWRSLLGYIPQSIFLLDDTIRNNVAFGISVEQIDDEQVWSSLRSARLEEYVRSLPKGLNTLVGERGVRMSGGQRQRLGISRALYQRPSILVLDEATSALDIQTEVEVMKAITDLQKSHTLIMIAHRLSTVERCDRLYLLRDGEIETIGTYEHLIKVSSTFRSFAVSSQDA